MTHDRVNDSQLPAVDASCRCHRRLFAVAIGAVTQAGQIVMSAGGDSWTKTLQMDSD